ncbi:MAG: hypothetical protein GY832_46075 [Chloroflexi bacterium]|nr:hypothetical protein [Chloroflexota bacterium]
MTERRIRLILVIALLATLVLPWGWNPLSDFGSDGLSNAFFIFWWSSEILSTILGRTEIINGIDSFGFLLFLMAVSILSLFNICLIVSSPKILKWVYRVLALVIVSLTWYYGLMIGSGLQGVGFCAHVITVSVAAYFEVLFVIRERFGESVHIKFIS